ncbi:NUDIX hydrolase [Mycolicibacterium cosmeticum]|uniref:NUDIX hydrolase n=1 Tax=Mycolicibacterium cosmeticum TaxID=258533 RepID=UPI003D16173B
MDVPRNPSGSGGHLHSADDELVAVYDAAGTVLGQAPRARVYAEGLWHASAGVLVRSLDGRRLYVHRRTDTKAVFAGMHDCLAGGVVGPGERPPQAAARELGEELGITGVPLTELAACSWDGQWAGRPMRCHLFAYQVRYDGPIRHQPEEIAEGWWWTDAQLRARLADPDWPFVPDTRNLLPQLLIG